MSEKKYVIYGHDACVYCNMAKDTLDTYGIPYEYKNVRESDEFKIEMFEKFPGVRTVPQILLITETGAEVHVGGYFDMSESLSEGK